jgi:hypothetical protein
MALLGAEMMKINLRLNKYLAETLGIALNQKTWSDHEELPLFLRAAYDLFLSSLMDLPLLLAVDKREEEVSPATLRKELDHVRTRFDGEIIYVRESMTSYHRSRLVQQKIAFVVPGNQMYLPMLGIDFREHFRRSRTPPREVLSPASQVLLLSALHGRLEGPLTPKSCAQSLNYSAMSMSRAFTELESAGLAETIDSGRHRILELKGPGEALWLQALEFLSTPVKRTLYATIPPRTASRLKLAGLPALAKRSFLAQPETEVLAIDSATWKQLSTAQVIAELPYREPDCVTLEIWKYTPELLSGVESVDRLSLYLSLRHTEDERVEAALEELLEGMRW